MRDEQRCREAQWGKARGREVEKWEGQEPRRRRRERMRRNLVAKGCTF